MSEEDGGRIDWAHWRKPENRVVSLRKAVILSLGLEGDAGQENLGIYKRLNYAEHHIGAGRLVAHVSRPFENEQGTSMAAAIMKNVKRITVDLRDFAAWCASEGLEAPAEFLFLAENGLQSVAPYLDPKHPGYAPELHAAIEAWCAVHIGGYGNQKRTPAQRVEAWLAENREYVATTMGRIGRVCNPEYRKRGGAPKNTATKKTKP